MHAVRSHGLMHVRVPQVAFNIQISGPKHCWSVERAWGWLCTMLLPLPDFQRWYNRYNRTQPLCLASAVG